VGGSDLRAIRRALRDAPDLRPAHVFAGLPHVFRPERAGDLRAVIVFDLAGEDGGAWTVRIADGRLAVEEGAAPDADAVVGCDARTFLDLATGIVRPGEAFVEGRLRVRGDLALAMRFSKLVGD
jgi:hypothetical protein